MLRSYQIRFLFVIFIFVIACYFLLPSLIFFSLNNKELKYIKNNKDSFSKYLPFWSCKSHIVPGLDLQGGLYLMLNVDLEKAISNKLYRLLDDINNYSKEKSFIFQSVNINIDIINIYFLNTDNLDFFYNNILVNFKELELFHRKDRLVQLKLTSNFIKIIKQETMDRILKILRKRINQIGVNESSINKCGDSNIQIQLPGLENINDAKKIIGRTAQLEFFLLDDNAMFLENLKKLPNGVDLVKSKYLKPNQSIGMDLYLKFSKNKINEVKSFFKGKIPNNNKISYGIINKKKGVQFYRTYTLCNKVILTGNDLNDVYISMGSVSDSRPHVIINFNSIGSKIFAEFTKKNIGKRLAIMLENYVDSAPIINCAILEGSASILMGGGKNRQALIRDAKNLVLVLKSGALPAPVRFVEERIVGPSLGVESISQVKNAFFLSGFLIVLFMIFYYKVAGVISILGVIFNVIFVLSSFSFLEATLTLPGIAGLLLTVGISVDANIIINERIREELNSGRVLKQAIKSGYSSAFSTIMDANVTTFIAGIILWIYGSGPIQNFAVILLIGTVSSFFTSIFVTRVFFDIVVQFNFKQLLI